VVPQGGLKLVELAPGVTKDEVTSKTEARLVM
jgi:acyl CoA:acetate/3-ketoacid CoA transferase beta subunit